VRRGGSTWQTGWFFWKHWSAATSGKMCFDKGEETGTCDLTSANFKVQIKI
jgi:hypothetical protein